MDVGVSGLQPWSGVEYVKVAVADIPSANLRPHFHPVADKVAEVKAKGGRTLVHCIAGVSCPSPPPSASSQNCPLG